MSKKVKITNKARVFKAPCEIGRDNVTVTFPKSIVDYINIDGDEIFWAPVSGVIQLSGTQPHLVIPMMTVGEDSFVPQETNNRVVQAED